MFRKSSMIVHLQFFAGSDARQSEWLLQILIKTKNDDSFKDDIWYCIMESFQQSRIVLEY